MIATDRSTRIREARSLFRQAVLEQPAVFDADALHEWFARRAPWVEPILVEAMTISSIVNDRRRQHFPGSEDVLFGRSDGSLERYDATRHGRWTRSGHPSRVAPLHPRKGPSFPSRSHARPA